MRKTVLILSMTSIFFLGTFNMGISQDQPQPKKDTVNIDTDAKPTFYYAVEDEANPANGGSGISTTTIAIIGGVVVVAAGAFFLMKKKKN